MSKNNKKSQKNMKASKKSKIIAGLVIAVMAIAAIAYIVHFTGLLPKIIAGVKVTKTVDGQTTVIENIPVLEVNYHTRQVMSSYNISDEMLDQVADTANGQTYRDLVYGAAADEITNAVCVNNAADAASFDDHGAPARYAESMLDGAVSMAQVYGITNDQYLTNIYGTGMTTRLFRDYTVRQARATEYENYVQQFVFAPSEDEIQAAFDENPAAFQQVDFSYKFFQVNEDEGYDIEAAQADADAVIALLEAADEVNAEAFTESVLTVVGENGSIAPELENLPEGQDPYEVKGYTRAMGYMNTDIIDFLFDQEAENGTYTTIATDNGVFVILLSDRYVDETPTVSYRTCTLYLSSRDGDMQAAINLANSYVATDAAAFDAFVKENSVNPNEMLTGGYYEGIKQDVFVSTEQKPVSAMDEELGAWLFAEGRTAGQTLVQVAPDNTSVRIVYFEASTPTWRNTCRLQARSLYSQQWRESLYSEGQSYEIAADVIDRLTY